MLIKKSISGLAKLIIGSLLLLLAVRFIPSSKEDGNPSVQGMVTTPILTATVTPINTSTPQSPAINSSLTKVTKVIDGDTFMIEVDSKEEAVRLIGIDTPETVDPRKPVQCFGKEASAKTKELIEGKNIILDSDPTQGDRDKYNRLLKYAYLENGIFVNQKLIEDGYAFEYTYNLPYKYQTEFKEAQKQAEANKRGLWADDACPTSTPKPTSAPKPTNTLILQNTQSQTSGSSKTSPDSYICDCGKNCDEMASCDEAYFQLNTCGCSKRDGDNDGVPCESLCN